MKIFIRKFEREVLYGFNSEAERNENKPRTGEIMAGLSARKVKEWRKTFKDFINIQQELAKLYEGETD